MSVYIPSVGNSKQSSTFLTQNYRQSNIGKPYIPSGGGEAKPYVPSAAVTRGGQPYIPSATASSTTSSFYSHQSPPYNPRCSYGGHSSGSQQTYCQQQQQQPYRQQPPTSPYSGQQQSTSPYGSQQQRPSWYVAYQQQPPSPYGGQQSPPSPYGGPSPYGDQHQYQSSPYGPYSGQHQHNQQQQSQNPYAAAASSTSSSGSAPKPIKVPGIGGGGSSRLNTNNNANDALLRKEFNSLDKDKNGYLDHKDIKKLFWGLAPASLCKQAIAYVDQNKDGKLSFEEYKAARAQLGHLVANANNQPNKAGKKWF